jgi:branched-chain amino acid transport system substrate-binding protein
MILLDPWASADGITEHEYKPNYVFRLSLKDSHAMPAMLKYASGKGWSPVGLLLPNTGWGRSNDAAAQAYLISHPEITVARTRWYNWGDANFGDLLRDFREAGVKALVFVANDIEGVALVNELAALPAEQRTPVISHWGVTGGRFFENAKDSLPKLQFRVVQTFSFFTAPKDVRDRFMLLAKKLYNADSWEKIAAPVGVGHAYDLTHLLALAIDKAGVPDRERVRAALEELGPYKGLCGDFSRPFTPERHDALGPESVFLATYREDGVIVPAP